MFMKNNEHTVNTIHGCTHYVSEKNRKQIEECKINLYYASEISIQKRDNLTSTILSRVTSRIRSDRLLGNTEQTKKSIASDVVGYKRNRTAYEAKHLDANEISSFAPVAPGNLRTGS